MGTLKSVCSSWSGLISHDLYEHTLEIVDYFECATRNLNPECSLVQRPIIKLSAIATKNTWLMRIITNQLKYSAGVLKCTSTIVYEFLYVQFRMSTMKPK